MTINQQPDDDRACEACAGSPAQVFTVATPGDAPGCFDTTDFALCPACASVLVDEVCATIDDRYLDVLAQAVERRLDRRGAVAA